MHLGGVRLSRAMLISIATAGICTWGFCVYAVSPSELLISKVQITGGVGKTSEDIVSIYNASNQAVDLNGLRLIKRTKTGTSDTTLKSWVSPTLVNPGAHYTWANSSNGFSESIQADCSSTQTISDDNGVALREGAENSGTIIDSFAWGEASNTFVENSPFPTNHSGGQYYARINNQDTNNSSIDFSILNYITEPVCGNNLIETGETCDDGNIISGDGCNNNCQTEVITPICGNGMIENGESCDDGNIIAQDGCSETCSIEANTILAGDIIINELVADPATGDEWIELYNKTQQNINLTGWTIEDGSGTKTILNGTINYETQTQFFIINKPKGSLNNSGDIIILKNPDADIIDTVTYGDWDDGDLSNNAPAAEKPYSLARLKDGETTQNEKNDFAITNSPTKGSANIISTPEDDNEIIIADTHDYSKDITLSEIFPNPLGADNEAQNGEFIEIFNKGQITVDLSNWRIEVNDNVLTIPVGTMINGQQYLSFLTKNILALINDGATVKLFQPLKQTSYQAITYKKASEDQAYALFALSSWQWTSRATPGTINFLALAPEAHFEILNEPVVNQQINFDSSDSFIGNKSATYHWSFGDGASSNLANPSHVFTKNGKAKVSLTLKTEYGASAISKTITIAKTNIELDNETDAEEDNTTTNQDESLANIIITDILANPEGVDKDKEWIKLKNNNQTKIDLKGYRIINADKKTIGEFKESYIINEGEEKIIDHKILTSNLGNSQQTIALANQTNNIISSLSYETAIEGKSYLEAQLNNDDKVAIATKKTSNEIFTTSGIAISAPGIFGSQYFYFLPEFGEPLYQIYNSKKLFPKLNAGDQLIVSGTYEEKAEGPKLKTKEAGDIKIIGSENIIKPEVSTSLDLKLAPYPRLALVEGTVASKKYPRIFLTDNQGEIEIYLASGTKLKTTDFTVGDKLSIFGILTNLNGTVRLQPHSTDDIKKIDEVSSDKISSDNPTKTTKLDFNNKQPIPKKNIIFYYLIAGSIIILSGGIYIIYKK